MVETRLIFSLFAELGCAGLLDVYYGLSERVCRASLTRVEVAKGMRTRGRGGVWKWMDYWLKRSVMEELFIGRNCHKFDVGVQL